MKQLLIKFCTLFIPSSKKRKEFRNKFVTKVSVQNEIIGQDNRIILLENGIEKDVPANFFKGLNIHIQGDSNLIKIETPYKFTNSRILIYGNNNKFILKKCSLTSNGVMNTAFLMGRVPANNREIVIDEHFTCGGAVFINNLSGNKITVGKDCMFSDGIYICADDGHAIYDIETNDIVNQSKYVKIGNHVWVSRRAYIGKDVEIADENIVGFGAIVVKSQLEKNTIIAGVPAKIVKRNVHWERHNNDYPKNRVAVESNPTS